MFLSHISIENRRELHKHFDIVQLYDRIIRSPASFPSYLAFCREIAPCSPVDAHLLSCLTAQDGCGVYRLSLGHMMAPQMPVFFDGMRIDANALLSALEHFTGPLGFDAFTDDGENAALIEELARKVSFEEEASLLFLFLLLHIQARRLISKDAMKFMCSHLEQQKKACLLPREALSSPAGACVLSFGRSDADKPQIKTIEGSFIPLRVRLEESALGRTLFFGDSLLMLHVPGRFPVFLSRLENCEGLRADQQAHHLLAALDSLRAGDREDDPIAVPVLHGRSCVLALTLSGRALQGGREIARDVLCAAADGDAFYFGLADGAVRVSRKSGETTRLFDAPAPVEEIAVSQGTLIWRRQDTSVRFTMPCPLKEG